MKILFVVPYPYGKAPSQRFRFEQYLGLLEEAGGEYEFAPFLDVHTWQILYNPGHVIQKVVGILKGFLKRISLLFSLAKFDFIFIHREATPIGPPFFEWIVAKVFGKKVIYDFDDAIWVPNTSVSNKIVAGIKWHHKVESICKWAYKVSCGNSYLQSYALQFNPNSIVNPTTIDTVHLHNQIKDQHTYDVVIGWTGTHSTMKYLDLVIPVLKKLEEKYKFIFKVISNQPPQFNLKSLEFTPWQKETEIQDLLSFNVGIMPLEDDQWAKGKCAFKALQYMALGIPAIVSPVGMNTEVVDDGINGFICQSADEWYIKLEGIILDSEMRSKLGRAARKKIENHYAVTANRLTFLGLFK
ncbi:glycosyltransferase [Nibribacter ruber]|uniref:Glycosyltransferase n=1 Tax=Nibribacter ruber TaxID=2698458 RepID=A0A6P1P3U1_9BACT|nr:glycosyltransferase family 4 protein [Nibribacter ruber]QHL89053.1 glycosyltransferase [Nibribacter ruber]